MILICTFTPNIWPTHLCSQGIFAEISLLSLPFIASHFIVFYVNSPETRVDEFGRWAHTQARQRSLEECWSVVVLVRVYWCVYFGARQKICSANCESCVAGLRFGFRLKTDDD